MNDQLQVTYLAQTENGQAIQDGIVEVEHCVVAIDRQQGLAALATGPTNTSQSPMKAIEILRDDMLTNLTATTASACLSESFDNIHGYLAETSAPHDGEAGTGLIGAQLMDDHISVVAAGGFICYSVVDDEITTLIEQAKDNPRLGTADPLSVFTVEHRLEDDELILLLSISTLDMIGEDFLRLTLSRFHDTPEMALRQINTRMTRRGTPTKPALVFVHVQQAAAQQGG